MKPTYLYIKQHNQTGLMYFGKTINKDPEKYKGSGTRWLKHIQKHGNDVTTIIVGCYVDQEALTKEAIEFSIKHDIVNSENWANLIVENGLPGGKGRPKGYKHSESSKQKMSKYAGNRSPTHAVTLANKNRERCLGVPLSDETKKKISDIKKEFRHSEETKEKMRGENNSFFGKTHSLEVKRLLSEKNRQVFTGVPKTRCCCCVCKKETTINVFGRCHGTNCKTH